VTICNVVITESLARVAVDTLSMARDGTRKPINKMFPLPCWNAVFASCGVALFARNAASVLQGQSGAFDEVLRRAPAIMDEAWRLTQKEARELAVQFVAPHPEVNVAYLVGWSDELERVVGRCCWQRDADGFKMRDIAGFEIRPYPNKDHVPEWAARFSALPYPDTAESMTRLARMQAAFIRDVLPGQEPGGRLIVAEITREGMTVRAAGAL